MKTRILAVSDIAKIVQTVGLDALMDEAIAGLAAVFESYDAEKTVIPVRGGFKYRHPQLGLVEWMPCMRLGDGVYIKVVGYHPESGNRYGLPTILSTQGMYSVTDGHLDSLMDASFATALRTGAASAVASQVLARPDSRSLGLIGTGAQAVTQLHALSRVFDFEEVWLFDTDPAAMDSFASRIQRLNLPDLKLHAAPVAEWLGQVDILVTATSVDIGEGPVFEGAEMRPHVHINAVGSDFPGKTEVPRKVLQRALVCPDFPEQAAAEGECQQLMPEDVGPDIHHLLRDKPRYIDARDQITVFDSTGWALEDMVTSDIFRKYASKLNLGTEVELETITEDHLDPYQFLDSQGGGD